MTDPRTRLKLGRLQLSSDLGCVGRRPKVLKHVFPILNHVLSQVAILLGKHKNEQSQLSSSKGTYAHFL